MVNEVKVYQAGKIEHQNMKKNEVHNFGLLDTRLHFSGESPADTAKVNRN